METETCYSGFVPLITNWGLSIETITIIILLLISAIISGTEVAYFSLSKVHIEKLKSTKSKTNNTITYLLKTPEKLLATILIINNIVNIGIIILSKYVSDAIITRTYSTMEPWQIFTIQICGITALLLLFGEILPKIFASYFPIKFSKFMAFPMLVLTKTFHIMSKPLVNSTSIFKKKFVRVRHNISIDELSDALSLTKPHLSNNKIMLEGIVKFGQIEASEIMKPRVDITAIDIKYNYTQLLSVIIETEYSRIPIYHKTLDNIKGILYVKDLLRYVHETENFAWQKLLRKPYFIPETKKIEDLLCEFQRDKIHMAIVVDEYGGTAGIVTMEDVIEQILGEISDEYDTDEEKTFLKIDNKNYIFEGKTLINDFCKITKIDDDYFEKDRGDADTLAGLILEIKGEMPKQGLEIEYEDLLFTIEAVDKRRIKQIRVKIK